MTARVKGPGPWCGTAGGYTNHGCRCEACRAANRVKQREYMARSEVQRRRHTQAGQARRLRLRLAEREQLARLAGLR